MVASYFAIALHSAKLFLYYSSLRSKAQIGFADCILALVHVCAAPSAFPFGWNRAGLKTIFAVVIPATRLVIFLPAPFPSKPQWPARLRGRCVHRRPYTARAGVGAAASAERAGAF